MAQNAALPAHHHMPKAISLNLFRLRRDVAAVDGFNAKVAILLTRAVGTMWCFWVFNGIALVSLPAAIHLHSLTVLINWVSSNWIQLILLPALMVGQNLQTAAGDARQAALSEHMDLVVDRLDVETKGGLEIVLTAVNRTRGDLQGFTEALRKLLAAQSLAKPGEPPADPVPAEPA